MERVPQYPNNIKFPNMVLTFTLYTCTCMSICSDGTLYMYMYMYMYM